MSSVVDTLFQQRDYEVISTSPGRLTTAGRTWYRRQGGWRIVSTACQNFPCSLIDSIISLFPEETQVSLWCYAIHRDPKHFSPLTDTFWPDRWFTRDEYISPTGTVIPAEKVITNRDLFIPFSAGPMVCAGKAVAQTEMRAVVCAVIQRFEVTFANEASMDAWEGKVEEVFTTRRGSLPVRVSVRK